MLNHKYKIDKNIKKLIKNLLFTTNIKILIMEKLKILIMEKLKIFFTLVFLFCSIEIQSMSHLPKDKDKLSIELIKAIKNNNINEVKKFIQQGADINTIQLDNYGYNITPLTLAAHDGNKDIVEFLLNQPGININLASTLGTALHYAVLRHDENHLEIAKLLIEKGADINNRSNDEKTTPLMYAVMNNNIKGAILLINQDKINLNLTNKAGDTALQIAKKLHFNSIAGLIKAKQNGEKDFTKYLEQYSKDMDLIDAVKENNLDKVKDLISKGADVNVANINQYTPLILAVSKNYINIVEELLKSAEIDVNLKIEIDNEITTPLIKAIDTNNIEVIKLLLGHSKIDVNLKGYGIDTPLIHAIKKGNIEVINLLLNHSKIDVNLRDNGGYTALMHAVSAVSENYQEAVQLLLNHPNIDLSLKNYHNETALDLAKKLGRNQIMKLINLISGYKSRIQDLSQSLIALSRYH